MEQTEQTYVQSSFIFSPVTADDEEMFQSFKKNIDSKLRKTFPSIPANFELKPVSVHRIQGCGMFYEFKIALPDSQYVKIKFNTNEGYIMGKKVAERLEDGITIDTELTSTPN